MRAVAAIVGTARGDRKEEWESDSGATFHMSHTHAGMSAYKKASPGTNVEIADGNILPVDGFWRIEVDLDQPGHTTKMVKMDDVAYVLGLSRNLLSTVKVVEQWGKPLMTRPTIGGERGCSKFVPVLGGDGTKIAPTGDISDQVPGGMS